MSIHPLPSLILLGTGAAFLLLAAVFLAHGLRTRRLAEGFTDRAIEIEAEVVEIHAKDIGLGAEPDTRYFLRVRFTPTGGEPVETDTMTAAPYPPPRVGEQVAVSYDPQHPQRADVVRSGDASAGAGRTSFLMAWLALALALAMPAAWLVLALVVWTV